MINSQSKIGPRTTTRVLVNNEMLDVACLAVYRGSLQERHILSLRAAVVVGLDTLSNSTPVEQQLLMKRTIKYNYNGDIALNLLFDAAERRMIHDVRLILQNFTMDKVRIPYIIQLALLSLARVQQ